MRELCRRGVEGLYDKVFSRTEACEAQRFRAVQTAVQIERTEAGKPPLFPALPVENGIANPETYVEEHLDESDLYAILSGAMPLTSDYLDCLADKVDASDALTRRPTGSGAIDHK
jgi:hypothetical protein